MEKITILTEPIKYSFTDKVRSFFSKRKQFLSNEKKLGYGPSSVLRSLLNGFEKNGVNFNYNPKKTEKIGETVIVLSNIETLEQAIKLKKNKKIRHLLAGPNLVVLPSEKNYLICSRYIDTYLVNSEWTKEMYVKDAPELKNKIAIWPAGVDTNYWKPGKIKKDYVLIYIKSANKKIVKNIINFLKENSFMVKIIKYSEYKQDEYLRFLQKSKFAIFFSESESQGIALFEAWSCNVPTLVWDRGYAIVNIKGLFKKRVVASSAPYLSNQTGLSFKNKKDFQNFFIKFTNMLKNKKFKPRNYVLNNYSDKMSAEKLLNIILNTTKKHF